MQEEEKTRKTVGESKTDDERGVIESKRELEKHCGAT